MKAQDFIEEFYVNYFEIYKEKLVSLLEKNNYKLYRYVPINQFLKTNYKSNLLHKKQYGFDSLLNKYNFHNKPSFFNDRVWMLLVDGATVYRDSSITFKFNNELETIAI